MFQVEEVYKYRSVEATDVLKSLGVLSCAFELSALAADSSRDGDFEPCRKPSRVAIAMMYLFLHFRFWNLSVQ